MQRWPASDFLAFRRFFRQVQYLTGIDFGAFQTVSNHHFTKGSLGAQ